MAQWDRLTQLPDAYKQQLDELYNRDALPMDVRHYLSAWIEKQEWRRAAQDHDFAMTLFQVLLENLDIQHSLFVQEEAFLLQHNIRRRKRNFQGYLDDPCALAQTILWFLEKEKDILRNADLAEQVQLLHVAEEAMGTSNQLEIERKIAGLRNDVECLERTMSCLEEQQDEFDFKFQTYKMEAVADEAAQIKQTKVFQQLINRLDECRKSTLSELHKLLDRTDALIAILVKKELVEWKKRQQKACIGAPDNVCLDQLEKWFTYVAVCLFRVRDFLDKLEELVGKVSYNTDPVKSQKPKLQKRTDTLLKDLLQSSFVVETQPSMPQGKGPLVLRTNVQFAVKTRLLVEFPELNHSMKVNVCMDREAPPIKGYRRFNVFGTKSKALNMSESQSGGMVADFRHLTLKEQKCGGGGKGINDISLSVTEELHIIYFDTLFEMKGLSIELQASSLPVVVISNSSQQQSACASILWFNLLSVDTKENTHDIFWVWFDGILVMVKTFLEDLWRDGLIMGFVSKIKEKHLLKKKQRGTFLLRFSESVIGGITFSWVEIDMNGEPEVKTVQPFNKIDLLQIPFCEIIRNFQILEAENIPQSPLLYLYPNTPKDEAFGKYYCEKSGSDSLYLQYIKTKLVFVSKEKTPEGRSPMPSAMEKGEGLDLMSGLGGEAANPSGSSPLLMSLLEVYLPEPMLCDSLAATDDQASMFFPSPFNSSDELVLPDFTLTGLNCLPPQSCGSIFQ
ncbi:signal transducer and activator of transcription 2 isoform 2-T3 [Spinachia spinachia]